MASHSTPKIRGSTLSNVLAMGKSDHELPIGHRYRLAGPRTNITDVIADSAGVIRAKRVAHYGGGEVVLCPAFGKVIRNGLGPGRAGEITLVCTPELRDASIELLRATHYRGATNRGMMLAMHQPGKNIVRGCIVLDSLTFGNPCGRALIALRMGRDLAGMSNGDLVRDLGLAWVSRIAVAEGYRGRGVASALLRAAEEMVRKHWVPKPRWIEVLTTITASGENRYPLFPRQDLFVQAGYTRSPYVSYARPEPMPAGGQARARRAYYFKELR